MDTILTATDQLFDSSGDTGEMVRQARILAQATSKLVNELKLQAETHNDSTQQKKLLAAAKQLADATARMVEAAKVGGRGGFFIYWAIQWFLEYRQISNIKHLSSQ